MKKTILANVGGFTPLIDILLQERGLTYAAIFGRVWRYCQMDDGVCKASMITIADELQLDRTTVMNYVKEMCKDGYLKDLTPDVKGRPHEYADTGKAGLRVEITAGVGKSDTPLKPVGKSDTYLSENPTGATLQPVGKSDTKRRESLRESKRRPLAVRLSIENQIASGFTTIQADEEALVKQAVQQHFKLTPKWELQYKDKTRFVPQDFLDLVKEHGITAADIADIHTVWTTNKAFSWQKAPSLQNLYEKILVAWDIAKREKKAAAQSNGTNSSYVVH